MLVDGLPCRRRDGAQHSLAVVLEHLRQLVAAVRLPHEPDEVLNAVHSGDGGGDTATLSSPGRRERERDAAMGPTLPR